MTGVKVHLHFLPIIPELSFYFTCNFSYLFGSLIFQSTKNVLKSLGKIFIKWEFWSLIIQILSQ